ncbi:uncharacterized protein LOC134252861 [Saccostrea cucullata]|uniref:uncharacterized protein LOC134252861 n=1 Tax=Saccostrea cuccullata TaxID=36930 RepID=UPI002ED569D7
MWSILSIFSLMHFAHGSIFGALPHPEELTLKKRQTCSNNCSEDPHYCKKGGLCIGGDSVWTVHCECDAPYWGRRCQYVLHSYRLTVAYTMAVEETNHDNPQPVFNSPDEYDSIEIRTRTCGNAVHFPQCFYNKTGVDCSSVPETNKPCSWKSQTVYAYYAAQNSNREKTMCVDLNPTEKENFVQIGIRAKCNNKNGCNVKSSPGSTSWKVGTTILHFRTKVEPGTCHGQYIY